MPKLTMIASHAPTMRSLKQAVLASYQCGHCKEETVALAGCDPFCGHCGSPAMKQRAEAITASVFNQTEAEDSLTSAQCRQCTVANVMFDEELAQMPVNKEGHVEICCVECGTGMVLNPNVTLAGADDDTTATDEEDANADWAWDGDQPAEEASAEEEESEDDSDLSDDDTSADDEELEDDESNESDEDLEEEASAEDNPMIIMPKQKPVVASAEADDEEEEESEDEPVEEAEVIQSTQNPDQCDEPEDMNIDVLEALSSVGLSEDATAEFIPLNGKILANVNDQTVAVLHKTAETANADIFGEPAYMEAIAQTFNKDGLDATLASYGFQRNSFKAPAAMAMAFVQEKAKAVAAAEVADTVGDQTERLLHGLQLATAGMTRGFFRNTPHKVKERLIADLTTAGVQNAQAMVESALAETEDEHNQNVLALAQTLAARDPSSLNDLAETIASTTPVGSSTRSNGRQASTAQLENQLETPLRQVTTASFLNEPVQKGNSRVRELAQGGLFRIS
ncbi:ATPase [Pseudomonas phage vB_PpuM-Amme-1]